MYYHVWFVTKYRKVALQGKVDKIIKETLAECIQRHSYKVLALETNRDHVHMVVEAADIKDLSATIRTLKAVSAKELHSATSHYRVGNARHLTSKRPAVFLKTFG